MRSMVHGSRTDWRMAERFVSNRREFLTSGASLAIFPLAAQIAPGALVRNVSWANDPFTLGVASGDPSSTGVVLWTRLAPDPVQVSANPQDPIEVTWELSDDSSMKTVLKSGKVIATDTLGHSVHVEVHGLEPNRWYWYRFQSGDAISPVGRTRTSPGPDQLVDQLRFAFASCQHYESGLYTAYEHMANEELDLILHLGDYIYEGPPGRSGLRKHNSPEIVSLNDYRNRYGLYKSDPQLRAAHAHAPWLVVWDDHEFDNNCAGLISEELWVDPREYAVRRANAYQAYYENQPLRASAMPAGADMRLYRDIPFGTLASFAMLDTRQYRSDQPNGDGAKKLEGAVFHPKSTLLGTHQEAWLNAHLQDSRARWNVLGQQVMVGRVGRVSGDDKLYSMDQWSGYDAPRKRLLNQIQRLESANTVVLTGDIHSNWANELYADFDKLDQAPVAVEFVGTSISSGGNGYDKNKQEAELFRENPFVKFHNAERGYVSCRVTKDQWQTFFRTVPFVDRPGAPVQTRAEFVVEHNKPRLLS
ncbi:MAG: alkaline phosphatase D family protein [Pirellula sp.]